MDPFRIPPAVGQFPQDTGSRPFEEVCSLFVHNGGGSRNNPPNVLQNEEPRTASLGDIDDVEEQAGSFAIEASTAPGDRKVLAREAGNDAIHSAAPWRAIEREKVRPDKRRIEGARFHKRRNLGGCTGFPLHVTNGAISDAK